RNRARLRCYDERFNQRQICAELDNFFKTKQRMPQMIEHSEEQHDIERAQLRGGELANIERQIFNLRPEQFLRFQKRVERDAIDRCHLCTAPLAFETEPAVPCADIEHALATQILRQSEEADAPAQMFRGLKAGQHAAIR